MSLFFNIFNRGKEKEKVTTKPATKFNHKEAVEEFINSYNSNDMYFKVSYYDTTCGKWKEAPTIFNTRQQAVDAISSILFNCRTISRDLIKIKSYQY